MQLNHLNFYSQDKEQLESLLVENHHNPKNLNEILKGVYCFRPRPWKSNPQLSNELITLLNNTYDIALPEIERIQYSEDGTIKFLIKLKDQTKIETVALPFSKKYTLCLSSQAGCAMKCSFCFTGTQGLKRNLQSGEIISQYIVVYRWLIKNKSIKILPNIVFMGQGEPLHNFEEIKKALHIFTTMNGIKLSPRQITLSTSGYLPGLMRYSELPPINWALSLHSINNDIRNQLIPLNKKYPLDNLVKLLKEISVKNNQYITMEYLLISNLNDSESDALELVEYLDDLPVLINLIPYNEFPGGIYKRPSDVAITLFKNVLVEHKMRTFLRGVKGSDILAACGQLANS